MAVGENVEVLHVAFGTDCHPLAPVAVVGDEEMAFALVHDGPAVTGKDAKLHGVVVVDMVRSGTPVQGAGGTHQVARGLKARMPGDGLTVELEGYGEIVLGKLSALVGKRDRGGADDHAFTVPGGGELGYGKVAVDYRKGGIVLENAFF